jgi:hypothetical protein
MATTFDITNSVDVTDAATFIPTVYSMEVLAAYKANLVLANLVTLLNHKGKKGNAISIPVPTRGTASQKSANNVVTLITNTESSVTVSINQHWEYSRLIEDIVEFQALPSIRRFYTNDAGYALAKKIDTLLHALAATWGGATAYEGTAANGTGAVIGSDGTTQWSDANAGNGATFSDTGVRRLVQELDDTDTPSRDRVLVVPPVEKRKMLAEPRFTEQSFVGERGSENSIRNGFVLPLYGLDVFVSSNCATLTASDGVTTYRAALAFQKEALVLAEQVAPRVQQQYKLEALGTLVTSDSIFGVKTVRGGTEAQDGVGCKAIVVPAV